MLARFRRDQAGANAVEFALVLPVLVILLFGIMYGASLFNTQQTVTQAAREGARYGATLPLSEHGDGSFPPGDGWYDAVHDRSKSVLDVDRPLTNPGEPSICVRFYDGEGGSDDNGVAACAGADASGTVDDARVVVYVTRPASLELGVARIGPLTLTARAIGRFEHEIE